eukprot:Nk52_evm37s270 gene=Nk52_evmTU37s270
MIEEKIGKSGTIAASGKGGEESVLVFALFSGLASAIKVVKLGMNPVTGPEALCEAKKLYKLNLKFPKSAPTDNTFKDLNRLLAESEKAKTVLQKNFFLVGEQSAHSKVVRNANMHSKGKSLT